MGNSTPGILGRIRQNHAIEHAAMHILAGSVPGLRLFAYSDWTGFLVFGKVETIALADAVREGLLRLRQGETYLAIHPHCGTNIAVPLGLSGGLLLAAASLPRAWRFTRLACVLLAGFTYGIRQPLSAAAQKYMTTSHDLARARVLAVTNINPRGTPIHRVLLRA